MNSLKFLWGLTIVSVGSLFMLTNFGYISGTIWLDIIRLWPIIIIFIGLKLVVKNEYVILVLGLVSLLLGLAFVLSNNDNKWQYKAPYMPIVGNSDYEVSQVYSERHDKGQVNRLNLSINTGANKFVVKDLPEESEDLYKIEANNLFKLELGKELDGDGYELSVGEQTRRMMSMPRFSANRELTIYVSSKVGLSLDLNNGASEIDLDFSNLNLTDLEIRAGASSGNLVFSDKAGLKNISLASGATNFKMYFPENVGLEIENHSGLSNVKISDMFKMSEEKDDITKSVLYDSAKSKYKVDIKTGASTVEILNK